MENEMKAIIKTKSGEVLEPTIVRYLSQKAFCMEQVERFRQRKERMEERAPQREQRFNPIILPFALIIVILAFAAAVV
jgi:hypothetical protein